ncbi:alpha-xylosidase [Nonomuraea rosea]|uniref:Alpha-xylosidase n=1 Tax=Nonomuraea rosea TaxID=638574 RepID=A0ABP6Z8K6_9ACTN
MKFTDGYWMMLPGVRSQSPVDVLDVESGPGSLSVYGTVWPIRDRTDLLAGPLVTLTFTAPMADVIAVTITHLDGGDPRGPEFPVTAFAGMKGIVHETEEKAVLASGALSAHVSRSAPWRVEFRAGDRVLTASRAKSTAFIETGDGSHYIREQLDLGADHFVYGLGERFGPMVKNGQSVDSWNADGGTSTEQSYKCVPFYLTNAGYGVFVNHPGKVSFEVASEAVSRVQFSVRDQSLQYFVIHGPTPKEILRKFTALTGRPALPPAWSFGLWLSTSFTTSYDEETVTGFVEGMRERDLPVSVFHFDCFWMREFQWCDFAWDPRTFPDPRGMLARLKERGLRICLWINPYVAQRSPLFAEGKAKGYFLKRPDQEVWQWDLWQPGLAVVDFTNPAARDWWTAKLDALLDMGVDCFKTDFGERIPTDVAYFDGSDPERMHNYYSYLFNECVFELLRSRFGAGGAVVFARAATAGGQRFPVHWGGDCECTFEAMAENLRGGLSLGMSGFGFWSHDIGGFIGTPEPELFKRWIAFGLLSSHSRLHGHDSYRVPWLFDEESVRVLRTFTELKCRLMPYLYEVAREACTGGVPMMRAMPIEFPGDPSCTHLERQYMLGPDLLVAPVLTHGGHVAYYVPEGTWTSFRTGEPTRGGRWVRETHAFDSVPLLVRPGAVIPVGAIGDRPDYDYGTGVTLRAYELAEGRTVTVTVPSPDGRPCSTFTVTRRGGAVHAERHGAPGEWRLLLVGVRKVASVLGGTMEPHEHGTLLQATGNRLTAVR